MTEKISVGYIGLGNIGKPSAKHLIGDTYNAHVYDVYQPAVDELVELGATGCTSPAELAGSCVHIGICVRDDSQVEKLLYGEPGPQGSGLLGSGLLDNAAPGTIIAIHSTVTQAGILKWAADAEARQIRLIDAPITGGASGAEAGTLCYMVGGEKATVAAATPVFETSADKVVHAGELGTGIILKLCNNLITYAPFPGPSMPLSGCSAHCPRAGPTRFSAACPKRNRGYCTVWRWRRRQRATLRLCCSRVSAKACPPLPSATK